jgi:hypothetical protein
VPVDERYPNMPSNTFVVSDVETYPSWLELFLNTIPDDFVPVSVPPAFVSDTRPLTNVFPDVAATVNASVSYANNVPVSVINESPIDESLIQVHYLHMILMHLLLQQHLEIH